MPCDYKTYPKNWPAIREEVRRRAGNKCENCGVENHAIGYRNLQGIFCQLARKISARGEMAIVGARAYKLIRIVCTVAHLNQNKKDSRRRNLKFLCQKCHLGHDLKARQKAKCSCSVDWTKKGKLKICKIHN